MKFENVLQNILAALTLSIVSLSMGAAFGIMSGRGAVAGMISAAILAFIGSVFGGTKIQCSGPTAPVITLVLGLMASQSDLSFTGISTDQFLNLVFILGGILMFLMGIFKLGKYIAVIPNVVISGFMTGIGALILRSQFNELWSYAATDTFEIKIFWVLATVLICFGAPYVFKKLIPKWAGLLSGTLIALVLGTVFAKVFSLPIERINLGDQSQGLLNSLEAFSFVGIENITRAGLQIAVLWAVQLCLTMYLDTLMTAIVMDRLTRTKTNRQKELMAQGSAGILIGLIGGIPGAQATVRSVLIFKEGATSRWAGGLAGIFCIVLLLVFKDVLGLVPRAVFIGILIKIAFDIIDFQPLRLYAKELLSDHVWHNFFSRHDDDPIFVTNREIIFILGTTALTLWWGLIPAVACFTSLYWFCNRFIWPKNQMRDLELETETQSVEEE